MLQISSRCSRTRNQGIKLLWRPLRSSFPLILEKTKSEPTSFPWGRVSFQSWGWGLVRSRDFKIWIILKIFECTPNFVCKLESSFSNIFSKKIPWKLHAFAIFYVKTNFCLYFENDNFSIFKGVLTLWHHSDVIHKWLVLILVSMERGCPFLYTGSKFRLYYLQYWLSEGGCNNPLRKICFEKSSGEQVNLLNSILFEVSVLFECLVKLTFFSN